LKHLTRRERKRKRERKGGGREIEEKRQENSQSILQRGSINSTPNSGTTTTKDFFSLLIDKKINKPF